MPRILDQILRRTSKEPVIPRCPVHDVDMSLRGKMGRPARFSDQTEEEYTLIFFCPVKDCGETRAVDRKLAQIPVQGESQPRPDYIRMNENRS